MTENEKIINEEGTVAPVETESSQGQTVYKWDYAQQSAFDINQERKKKKRGAWVFAVIMTLAFSACLAILAGVLVWYESSGRSEITGEAVNAGAVADVINPSVVLIYCTNDTGFSYGTGFFIRSNGYIATNYHVVEGYDEITVTLYSAKQIPAKLIGFDQEKDLAVLKIEGSAYPVPTMGNSDAVTVGEAAIAIGHPSGAAGAWTTTQGIVSAVERRVTSTTPIPMIQTDAAVNPGNSGGPLCNGRAEIIGVVTRKITDYEGFGLAIPINEAMEILEGILEGKSDTPAEEPATHPTIGIRGGDITKGATYMVNNEVFTASRTGILVSQVEVENGLQPHDIIYAIDGTAVNSVNALVSVLSEHTAGDRVTLSVTRNGKDIQVTVTLR